MLSRLFFSRVDYEPPQAFGFTIGTPVTYPPKPKVGIGRVLNAAANLILDPLYSLFSAEAHRFVGHYAKAKVSIAFPELLWFPGSESHKASSGHSKLYSFPESYFLSRESFAEFMSILNRQHYSVHRHHGKIEISSLSSLKKTHQDIEKAYLASVLTLSEDGRSASFSLPKGFFSQAYLQYLTNKHLPYAFKGANFSVSTDESANTIDLNINFIKPTTRRSAVGKLYYPLKKHYLSWRYYRATGVWPTGTSGFKRTAVIDFVSEQETRRLMERLATYKEETGASVKLSRAAWTSVFTTKYDRLRFLPKGSAGRLNAKSPRFWLALAYFLLIFPMIIGGICKLLSLPFLKRDMESYEARHVAQENDTFEAMRPAPWGDLPGEGYSPALGEALKEQGGYLSEETESADIESNDLEDNLSLIFTRRKNLKRRSQRVENYQLNASELLDQIHDALSEKTVEIAGRETPVLERIKIKTSRETFTNRTRNRQALTESEQQALHTIASETLEAVSPNAQYTIRIHESYITIRLQSPTALPTPTLI